MTSDEIAQWRQLRADPGGGSPPTVTAEVAPLDDRWALRAAAWNGADPVSETWVSCREETMARGLASEILTRGEPGAVERLGAHVQLAEQAAVHWAQTRASATPVDYDAMAAQIRAVWPENVAASALGCRAWPTLASKLAVAQQDGHDLDRLLCAINTGGIPSARKPAALASYLLDQTTAGRTPESPSVSPDLGGGESRPLPPGEILTWVDQLGPRSEMDRIAAVAVVGQYGPAVDARLLTRFPDLLDEAAHWRGDEVTAEGLAGERERSAAAHRATADDPRTPAHEDLAEQDLAQRDLHAADLAEPGVRAGPLNGL